MTMSGSLYTITLISSLTQDQRYQCVVEYGNITITKMAIIDNIREYKPHQLCLWGRGTAVSIL